MSIQILSNFNATAQVAYVRDEKHGEMFMEGSVGETIDSIAELAVQFAVKYADDILKDEDPDTPVSEDSTISKRDEAIIDTVQIIVREIEKKLIKDKVNRDLNELPDSLKEILGNVLAKKFTEMCESREESDDE